MRRVFLCLLFTVSFLPGVYSQGATPEFLKEPANWAFEKFMLPAGFAPAMKYSGTEELRFAPGMFKKDTVDYFTYIFIARLDFIRTISKEAIGSYLLDYYRGLCSNVAKDRKLMIDTTKVTVSVEKKNDLPSQEVIYDASLNILGVFADGAPVKLNMEVKVMEDAANKRIYLIFITSPQPKGNEIWKQLYQVQKEFKIPATTSGKK